MNKRWIFLLVILSLAVSSISCGISVDLGTKNSSPTPPPLTAAATTTSEPASPTSTAIPPTATLSPAATATNQPVESPVGEQPAEPQLAEPTATPVPLPEVISVHNAPGLSFKDGFHRIGFASKITRITRRENSTPVVHHETGVVEYQRFLASLDH